MFHVQGVAARYLHYSAPAAAELARSLPIADRYASAHLSARGGEAKFNNNNNKKKKKKLEKKKRVEQRNTPIESGERREGGGGEDTGPCTLATFEVGYVQHVCMYVCTGGGGYPVR